MLCIGRDGITLGVRLQQGWLYEVASTGTLSIYDRRGRRLGTVYVAVTPEPVTFRQLALVWGVIPALTKHYPDYDAMLPFTRDFITAQGLAQPGDRVVVTLNGKFLPYTKW